MVLAKSASPREFPPIHVGNLTVKVVTERTKTGIEYQKIIAFEETNSAKILWEFAPDLPELKPLDQKLKNNVQAPRIFFKYFEKSGKNIEVSVDSPPYPKYELDPSSGKVIEISTWRTTPIAK